MIKMSFINKQKKNIISIYNSGSGLSTNERKEKRIVDGLTTRRAEQKLLIPVRDKSQNKNNVLNPFGEKKRDESCNRVVGKVYCTLLMH